MSGAPRGLVLRHVVAGIGDDDECFTMPWLQGFSVVRTPGDQAVVFVLGGAVHEEIEAQVTVMTFSMLARDASLVGAMLRQPSIAPSQSLSITPIAGIPALSLDSTIVRFAWEDLRQMRVQSEPIPPAFAPAKVCSLRLVRAPHLPAPGELPKPERGGQVISSLRVFLDADEAEDLSLVLRIPEAH